MKRHLLLSLSALGVLGATLLPTQADAYPLTPWGSKVPDKTIALTPYLFAGGGDGVWLNPYLYGGYGIGDKLDVTVGVGLYSTIGGGAFTAAPSGLEIMPRYFFTENLAASLHFYVSGGALSPAPEIHYVQSFGKFSLTANVGYKPQIGFDGTTDAGQIFAYVAPEFYISKQLAFFVEVNPLFDIKSGATAVTLVPGVWFALDPDQKYSFAVGANIPIIVFEGDDDTPYLGAWFSTTFGGE